MYQSNFQASLRGPWRLCLEYHVQYATGCLVVFKEVIVVLDEDICVKLRKDEDRIGYQKES